MPAIENERVGLSILKFEDAANDYFVVPAIVAMLRSTFEYRRILWQDRNTGQAFATLKAIEFTRPGRGESSTEISLVLGENIDREMFSLDKNIESLRILTNTPQYEWWVERYGIEATDGNSRFVAALVDCRDHSDACCKTTECTSISRQLYFIR